MPKRWHAAPTPGAPAQVPLPWLQRRSGAQGTVLQLPPAPARAAQRGPAMFAKSQYAVTSHSRIVQSCPTGARASHRLITGWQNADSTQSREVAQGVVTAFRGRHRLSSQYWSAGQYWCDAPRLSHHPFGADPVTQMPFSQARPAWQRTPGAPQREPSAAVTNGTQVSMSVASSLQ
jgi:hypothetical protein